MSLLGIIETLRRNLKAVIAGCVCVLVLVAIADVVRLTTADKHHATSEHAAAPAGEHAVAPATEHATTALATEPPASFHEEESEGGFWAEAYEIAEKTPVFWTLFGFLGCVLIVVVSKSYGHFGVSVKEDYYSE